MRPDAHALLAAYAADAVDDDERLDVEAHLESCATCTDDLRDLRETLASLAAVTEEAPPPSLRDAVLARAAATPQVRAGHALAVNDVFPPVADLDPDLDGAEASGYPASVPAAPAVVATRRRGSRLLLALAAGFALLTLLGAGASGVLWQRLSDEGAQRSATAAVLAAADGQVLRVGAELPADLAAAPGSGDVVVVASESSDAAVLVASGLPQAPSGRTWQAWFVDDAGARSAGVFDSSGGVVLLDGELAGASAVAVSLEPAGGSQAPTTTPVAVLALQS